MGTLYLHIGTPKTGTTSIQSFCEKNRAALAARGCCYPEPADPIDTKNGHFMVVNDLEADGSFSNAESARVWKAQMDAYQALLRGCDKLIVSEESIWWAAKFKYPGLWACLKREAGARGFDVKIIVYLRRQDLFLTSWWAQHVKRGISMSMFPGTSWEEMHATLDEQIPLDYYDFLETAAAHFGREAIVARIYERERFPHGDVIEDFLQIFGLRMDEGFAPPEEEKNPSIGVGNALEIKRIVNCIPDIPPSMLALAKRAAEACYAEEQKWGCAYSMFSEEERDAFLARYEASNRLLARDYFGGGWPLFAAPEKLPPKWTPDNPHMEESIVLFFSLAFEMQQERLDALYREQHRGSWLRRKLRGLKRRILGKK